MKPTIRVVSACIALGVTYCSSCPLLFLLPCPPLSLSKLVFSLAIEFNLPNPNGKEGGACISALLQVLYERGHEVGTLSWISVMEDMWEQLKRLGYDQVPQLSSSRWIDVYRPMYIVPPNSGKRRAMVGIFPHTEDYLVDAVY